MEEGPDSDDSTYKESDHSQKCFKEMAQLWYDKRYCDVHLMVLDLLDTPTSAILAHRVVLAAVIPYFKAMFESQMREKEEKEITLHNLTPVAVKSLVEYAYTGQVTASISHSCTIILILACFL